MTERNPVTEVDVRYGNDGAGPTEWAAAVRYLDGAEIFWLSTVRADGRPHVTPLIAVWFEDAFYICTGPDEQKAKNLAVNPRCSLTTGTNAFDHGVDLVVEGTAAAVRDDVQLQRVADAIEAKYGSRWRFEVAGGAFHHHGGEVVVFAVAPSTAYAFAKGEQPSQTRYRFDAPGQGSV